MPQAHAHARDFNPLDDYILARIQFRVDQLVTRYGFREDEAEDLRHDFIVAVLESVPDFDPDKASWRTYVRHILKKTAVDQIRRREVQQRYFAPTGGTFEHLVGEEAEQFEPERRRRAGSNRLEHEQLDLASDLEQAMATLPPRARQVAQLLKTDSVAEIAAKLGVSRATVHRDMQKIREAFLSHDLDEYC